MRENVTKKEFLVPTDLSEVQNASLKVLSSLKDLHLSEACLFDIRLCLEEALINAMKYGNDLRKDRKVHLAVEADPHQIRLTIEDEGEGFDPGKLPNCTEKDNLLKTRGRGVYLICQLMDEVRYNERGNQLMMVKTVRPEKQKSGHS